MFKVFKSAAIAAHQSALAITARGLSTSGGPLWFRASAPLQGEPLKKKKRLDPQILKAREDRKRKKIEKAIRKLEKVWYRSRRLYSRHRIVEQSIIHWTEISVY